VSACIATPISWPRLEAYVASSARDAAITEHVAACAACRACRDDIERDVVALPPLVVPDYAPRRWWRMWILPAMAAAAAALVLLVIVRPRPDPEPRDDVAQVKGVGEVMIDVVRARGNTITPGARTFAPGDRWKVIVTCPPDKGAWFDVAVVEAGTRTADYPLAPARVGCGNRVVVPGAFAITGARDNRVCVRVAVDAAPARALPRTGDDAVACVTLGPEAE
jgi:hypothetical protein